MLFVHVEIHRYGGDVWESNPPKLALAISQTVLKTAPITGQVAPPDCIAARPDGCTECVSHSNWIRPPFWAVLLNYESLYFLYSASLAKKRTSSVIIASFSFLAARFT